MTKRLYRQIHPQFALSGRVTYLAFSPMNHDRISVDDADKVSAELAWQIHSATNISAGVMVVTGEECEAYSLSVVPDPTPYRPAHMEIGFEKLQTEKGRKTAAKWLHKCAVRRGWCYRPASAE